MKHCTYCGRENEDIAVVCTECGTDLQPSGVEDSPRVGIRQRVAELAGRITTKQKRVIACIVVLVAGVAVYIASGYLHRPRMQEAEVIQVANAAAAAEGFRLSEYGSPQARFEYPDRNRTWMVMYNLKLPTPLGPPLPKPQSAHGAPRNFFVIVDDRTRHTQVGMFQRVGTLRGDGAPTQRVVPPRGLIDYRYYTNAGWSDSNAK